MLVNKLEFICKIKKISLNNKFELDLKLEFNNKINELSLNVLVFDSAHSQSYQLEI